MSIEKFVVVEGVAAPLALANVDTDVIIRIERLAKLARADLGRYAFEPLRYRADGSADPAFVLNRPPFRDARILVAGENFGCGSSREMAVWAIAGLGIRVIIAPSYGEIFFANCFQNGLLPVVLPAPTVARIAARLDAEPGAARMSVDLTRCEIRTAWGETIAFAVESLRRRMLLEGADEVELTLAREPDIAAFQARDRERRPWIYGAS
jgi:3-isopropylmalate/(R)-2-methylmalate dehydratase small subunit